MINKREVIKKICLTSLMLVLNIIFNRIFMLASITSFNKIGVADVFILFSSLFIGPLYGSVVGGFGDLFGALILPKGDINWFICLGKFVAGLVPGLFYILLKKIRNQKIMKYASYGLMAVICVLVTVFMNIIPTIKILDFNVTVELWAKILFPCLSFLLSFLLFLFLHLIEKRMKVESDYSIWFVTIVYELCFPLILFSVIKAFYYNVDFLFIFAIQLLLFIVDIILNVSLLNVLKKVKKISRFA